MRAVAIIRPAGIVLRAGLPLGFPNLDVPGYVVPVEELLEVLLIAPDVVRVHAPGLPVGPVDLLLEEGDGEGIVQALADDLAPVLAAVVHDGDEEEPTVGPVDDLIDCSRRYFTDIRKFMFIFFACKVVYFI